MLLLLGGALVQAGATPLNKEEQARVDKAIDAGAAFLKSTQGPQGSWFSPKQRHLVGYTALPGLTLLECGVPANDPAVRRAAAAVRKAVPSMDATYEIALSILFLDRLGDPKDSELIQTLAARLIGGQSATGGWSYKCPVVGKKMQQELFAALRKLDPLDDIPVQRKPANPGLQGIDKDKPKEDKPTFGKPPDLPDPPRAKPAAADANKAADIPARLKTLPVFRDNVNLPKREAKGKRESFPPASTDNSNTQFAILALWVAQRHDVPAKPSMRLIARRFDASQNGDGTWSYKYLTGEGTPSMTCVGLLGLAVGHGIAAEPQDKSPRKPLIDPRVLSGLTALSKSVGEPSGNWRFQPMENLYYLWSLERVGVLYGLPAIGDKDWYRWGAEILIANQQPRGNWANGEYIGSTVTIDTCLALLFLKRANFVADLTARLPFKADELNKSIIQAAPSSSLPGLSRNLEKKK